MKTISEDDLIGEDRIPSGMLAITHVRPADEDSPDGVAGDVSKA